MQVVAVAAGGAIGSVLRFWVSSGVYAVLGRSFPIGTLTVNVLGCLAMGLLYVLLLERMAVGPEWRAALLIGVLGGFTTFSSFSIETFNLIEGGELFKALLNIMLSVLSCVAATWLGVALARQV